jgi:hypothetical protein
MSMREAEVKLREFLASLSDEQLAAVERFCAVVGLGPLPAAERPVENMSAEECIQEWRRLCRRPIHEAAR